MDKSETLQNMRDIVRYRYSPEKFIAMLDKLGLTMPKKGTTVLNMQKFFELAFLTKIVTDFAELQPKPEQAEAQLLSIRDLQAKLVNIRTAGDGMEIDGDDDDGDDMTIHDFTDAILDVYFIESRQFQKNIILLSLNEIHKALGANPEALPVYTALLEILYAGDLRGSLDRTRKNVIAETATIIYSLVQGRPGSDIVKQWTVTNKSRREQQDIARKLDTGHIININHFYLSLLLEYYVGITGVVEEEGISYFLQDTNIDEDMMISRMLDIFMRNWFDKYAIDLMGKALTKYDSMNLFDGELIKTVAGSVAQNIYDRYLADPIFRDAVHDIEVFTYNGDHTLTVEKIKTYLSTTILYAMKLEDEQSKKKQRLARDKGLGLKKPVVRSSTGEHSINGQQINGTQKRAQKNVDARKQTRANAITEARRKESTGMDVVETGGKRNTKKQKKNQKKKTMKAPHKRTIKKRKRRKNKTSKNRS